MNIIKVTKIDIPFVHVAPSNPVPSQLQENVPGVLEHTPPLHGVPELHSLISRKKTRIFTVFLTSKHVNISVQNLPKMCML